MTQLNIIIFSKNRALQLDSLLRSIIKNINYPEPMITVVFKATDNEYKKGYQKISRKFKTSNILLFEENKFREDIIHLTEDFNLDTILMFLVDDNVVYKNLNLKKICGKFDKKHLFISTRLSPDYSKYRLPKYRTSDGIIEWSWYRFFRKTSGNPWYYPFSLDGNIFHSKDILKLIKKIDFNGPNSLESRMNKRKKQFLPLKRKALSYQESKVINNPLNRVQTEGETWHKNVSLKYLNNKYLLDYSIDNSIYYDLQPQDMHYSVNLKFIKE